MQFNFYENYQLLNTVELLKIVKQPEGYLPEAIEAATQVLKEREVTEQEHAVADNAVAKNAEKVNAGKQLKEQYSAHAENILEPILHPSNNVVPHKWVQILLLVLLVQFLVSLYTKLPYLWYVITSFIECNNYGSHSKNNTLMDCLSRLFDLYNIFTFASLFYIPLQIFLLYKRRRWGWILLFGDAVLSLFSIVNSLFTMYYFPNLVKANYGSLFIVGTLKAAIIYFLWREDIAEYFNISKETKKKLLIAICVFAISLFFLTKMLNEPSTGF